MNSSRGKVKNLIHAFEKKQGEIDQTMLNFFSTAATPRSARVHNVPGNGAPINMQTAEFMQQYQRQQREEQEHKEAYRLWQQQQQQQQGTTATPTASSISRRERRRRLHQAHTATNVVAYGSNTTTATTAGGGGGGGGNLISIVRDSDGALVKQSVAKLNDSNVTGAPPMVGEISNDNVNMTMTATGDNAEAEQQAATKRSSVSDLRKMFEGIITQTHEQQEAEETLSARRKRHSMGMTPRIKEKQQHAFFGDAAAAAAAAASAASAAGGGGGIPSETMLMPPPAPVAAKKMQDQSGKLPVAFREQFELHTNEMIKMTGWKAETDTPCQSKDEELNASLDNHLRMIDHVLQIPSPPIKSALYGWSLQLKQMSAQSMMDSEDCEWDAVEEENDEQEEKKLMKLQRKNLNIPNMELLQLFQFKSNLYREQHPEIVDFVNPFPMTRGYEKNHPPRDARQPTVTAMSMMQSTLKSPHQTFTTTSSPMSSSPTSNPTRSKIKSLGKLHRRKQLFGDSSTSPSGEGVSFERWMCQMEDKLQGMQGNVNVNGNEPGDRKSVV